MNRYRSLVMLTLLLGSASCRSKPQIPNEDVVRVTDASQFTRRYAHSRLAAWNVRASAAGTQCDVLLVETSIIMEESMVDAIHYGAGAYGVYEGGVQRFCRERAFRGVAYKDSSGRIWTYGNVTGAEAATLRRCDGDT